MARMIVNVTQPDRGVRERLRVVYANDAAMLIQITHVTAIEFATIAAANNYWR
ncbi:Hexameric tyrosine-coordinated heme protein (HTHP) [compost metagenome]